MLAQIVQMQLSVVGARLATFIINFQEHALATQPLLIIKDKAVLVSLHAQMVNGILVTTNARIAMQDVLFAKITQVNALNVKTDIDFCLDLVTNGVFLPKVLIAVKAVQNVITLETVLSVNQDLFKTN